MFMDNISFFQNIDNLAAILNLLFYFRQTHSGMRVHTHHKDLNKPDVIDVHSRWHQALSEAV